MRKVLNFLPNPGISENIRNVGNRGQEPGWEREGERVRVNVVVQA